MTTKYDNYMINKLDAKICWMYRQGDKFFIDIKSYI